MNAKVTGEKGHSQLTRINKMMMGVMPLLSLFMLAGCEKEAVGVAQTTNSEILLELLFENDGCKVYRFTDAGQSHYYANCAASTTVMETVRLGRSNRVVQNEIKTSYIVNDSVKKTK